MATANTFLGGLRTSRRRWRRLPQSSTVLAISESAVRVCMARDLSGGGAYLFSPSPPAVGAPVGIEFNLGSKRHFLVMATVVRAEPGLSPDVQAGFAVRFDADDTVKGHIDSALAALG